MRTSILLLITFASLCKLCYAAETSQQFKRQLQPASWLLNDGDKLLRIGDTAPQVKARWIKGKQINRYQKDMVYVLEFWATWCGPCKKAMPHVSQMAKKYGGKASFIGANILERSPMGYTLESWVDKFVKENNDKMDYAVCMDGTDGYMAKNYLTAAAQPGIPTTMIINKDGVLAWIGQPTEMEKPLQEIIDGTFDLKAFKRKIEPEQENAFKQQKEGMEMANAMKPIYEAFNAKKYPDVITAYRELVSKDKRFLIGAYGQYLAKQYYFSMLIVDPEKTYQEAVKLKDSTTLASSIAAIFSLYPNLEKKFYQYAIDFYSSQKEDSFDLPYLAGAYYEIGNTNKAIELQEKWIRITKSFTSPPSAESMSKDLERLNKYKSDLK